jgi:uncharacterized MAPEG superfamily protein
MVNELISFSNPNFIVYSICVFILSLKMIWTAQFTGFLRMKTKTFILNEDRKLLKTENKNNQEDTLLFQIRELHRNDVENVYLFFFISLIYILTSPSNLECKILLYGYVILRMIYNICYIFKLQPHRTRIFVFSVIIIFILLSKIAFFLDYYFGLIISVSTLSLIFIQACYYNIVLYQINK